MKYSTCNWPFAISNISISQAKVICAVCINHLIEEGNKKGIRISNRLIESYMDGHGDIVASLNDVFQCLTGSLQNASMMPNVIKLYKGLKIQFLFGYDYQRILDKYGYSSRKLRSAAKKDNPKINTSGRLWRMFSEGVLDAAKWMSQFKDFESFEKYLLPFHENEHHGVSILIASLSDGRIKGLGSALAYDFIKNLGLTISKDCAKPDTHTRETLVALGLCKKTSSNDDVVSVISDIALKAGINTYAMDKILWLANSGNFYDETFDRLWEVSQTIEHRKTIVKAIKGRWKLTR